MTQTSGSLASLSLTALDSMQAVLRRLGAERDVASLYAAAVKEAAAFFRATQCGLSLYDAATDTLHLIHPGIGLDAPQIEAIAARRPKACGSCMLTGPNTGSCGCSIRHTRRSPIPPS